jgi:hypothetical protein
MQAQQTLQAKLNTGYSKIPCDGCKGHHIKCDKNLDGCKNCSRRGINCTYLITRKRRGPKTKTESMIKLIESLSTSNQSTEVVETDISASNNENDSTTPDDNVLVKCSELQYSATSSPIQAAPLLPNDYTMLQVAPIDYPTVCQSACSLPMYDTNCYSLALPLQTNIVSFDPSFAIPTCDYYNWYPELPHFQPIESLDQTCIYNLQNSSPKNFSRDQNSNNY